LNNAAQAKAGGIIGSNNAIQGAISGVSNDLGGALATGTNLPGWATIGLGA
jgi:hypothetical protein